MLTSQYIELCDGYQHDSGVWNSVVGYFSCKRNPPSEASKLLLVGPAGAGKSCFVDTVIAATHGYIEVNRVRSGIAGGSSFKQLPFVNNYIWSSDSEYPPSQFSLTEHQIHCVVLVIDAPSVPTMQCVMWSKLSLVVDAAKMKGIPVLIIVTKIDEICPGIRHNPIHVFHADAFQEIITQIHSKIPEVPIHRILPMKNYVSETYTNSSLRMLTHLAVEKILQVSHAYRRDVEYSKNTNSSIAIFQRIGQIFSCRYVFMSLLLFVVAMLGLVACFGGIQYIKHKDKATMIFVRLWNNFEFTFGFMSADFRKLLEETHFSPDNEGYY